MKLINSILIILIISICSLIYITQGDPIFAESSPKNFIPTPAETETEIPYSLDDFYELSHVIQGEAGYCERDMMIGVGSVVLNRVASDKFPNTIYEVIHSPSQYTCNMNNTPTAEAEEVTDYLLRNGSQYPSDVLYQANSPQGTGTYKTLSTSYSTMYFCYG